MDKKRNSWQRHAEKRRNLPALAVRFILPCALLAIPITATAQIIEGNQFCGSLDNAYGPFDYTNRAHRRDRLPIVEGAHFNDGVFNLVSGMTSETPSRDIDYTLRAFPNHHRALDAMARLHRKHQMEKLPETNYSMNCYFDRAMRLAPDDPVVRLLKGIHMFKIGRLDAAEANFKAALQLAPDSAEIHYNLGLLYVRQGDYPSAREHAFRAYDQGFPLQGLRRQLIRADQLSTNAGTGPQKPPEVGKPDHD